MSLLRFEKISKSFFGVKAVEDISFELKAGRLLGLVGENGAGKSTLMNILGGVLTPDAGQMFLNDQLYNPRNPRDAKRSGIAFIHQELNLFTNLSITENLFVDAFPRLGGVFLDRPTMRTRTQKALQAVALEVSPETLVEGLTPGERQLVEIAKAINAEARLIIFDEPTTSLTERETDRLFKMLARLKEQGKAIVYISHILGDVLRLSDDIMVMRDGTLIAKDDRQAFDTSRMISLMVGRDLKQLYPERTDKPSSQPILTVKGLSQPGIAHDISFDLHRGEILGLFGLMGSGRSELARMLFGLDNFQQGDVKLDQQPVQMASPRDAIRQGMAFVTENRREEGLMMEASIADNMSLVTLTDYASQSPLINSHRLNERVQNMGSELKLKTATYSQAVKTLSGGNQQKVVLGKWIAAQPRVFMIDEPTRGIDVGAKYEVYTLVHRLAAEGAGVLFISSELEELIGVCDRILVMHNGEIVHNFSQPFQREVILAAAFKEAA